MDNNKSIQSGSQYRNIDKTIRNYRKNQTLFVISMVVTNALIIAFLTIYYSIRQRALVGALYLYDKASAMNLIDRMMHMNISRKTYEAGLEAMIEAGYTRNGYMYLIHINYENVINIVIGLILLLLLIYGLVHCYRIGRKDCLGSLKGYVRENGILKEQLNKEHEYNICQYKKMQEFVENIAHQIKTPLSVMTMKLEMLQDILQDILQSHICSPESTKADSINTEATGCLQQPYNNITGGITIISECTKSAFKVVLATDKVIIDYIVEESVESAVADKSKVIVDYGTDVKRVMYADEGWLAEALINIISNSYECICDKENGRVYIDISSNNEVCIIKIADNGEGIDKAKITSIFDRFAGKNSQNEFHAGIGLNLSKLIIEAHHGSIKASNSEKYGGAEFRILLPLYKLKGKVEHN